MALIGTDQFGNPYTITIDYATGAQIIAPAPGVSPSTGDNSIGRTALGIITSALRLINVVASGESVPVTEANDALDVFQQMIDGWNAERLAIFTTSANDYALVANQQVYTLGNGGDFDTNRPAQIDGMSAILLYDPSNPIEVPMSMYTVDQWQNQVPVKKVPGSFPLICYDDGGFPLRSLSMWPIPVQVNNVRIYSWQPLTLPASLRTVISLPPGYMEAFRYGLAVRLAAEFAAPVPAVVAQIAVSAMGRIKRMNMPDLNMQSDLVPNPAGYNWKADLFGIGW